MIQVDDERRWLYAAVDPATNELLHLRLFPTRTIQLIVLFLRELYAEQQIDGATSLVDAAPHLTAASDRLGFRIHIHRHGDRNAAERVFKEVKRHTFSFSNIFRNYKASNRRIVAPGFRHLVEPMLKSTRPGGRE